MTSAGLLQLSPLYRNRVNTPANRSSGFFFTSPLTPIICALLFMMGCGDSFEQDYIASRVTPIDIARQDIDAQRARLEKTPTDYLLLNRLGTSLQELADLSHDSAPHIEAIDMFDRAITHGAPSSDSQLAKARSYLALHKLDEARSSLALVSESNVTPKRVRLAVEGQLNLLTGDYELAKQNYESLRLAYKGAAQGEVMLGYIFDLLGDDADAQKRYSAGLTLIGEENARGQSWVHVLSGLNHFHRGRFQKAKASYELALEATPDDILALEHLAEIEEKLGNRAYAIQLYRRVVSLTRHPIFLAALADLVRQNGDESEANELFAEARLGIDDMIALTPEAAYEHAADFLLEHTDETDLAVSLLEKNVALRPNGNSYQQLAAAYLAAGRQKDAEVAIETALSQPAINADLYWIAAEIFQKSGSPSTADAYRLKALEINPRQAEM